VSNPRSLRCLVAILGVGASLALAGIAAADTSTPAPAPTARTSGLLELVRVIQAASHAADARLLTLAAQQEALIARKSWLASVVDRINCLEQVGCVSEGNEQLPPIPPPPPTDLFLVPPLPLSLPAVCGPGLQTCSLDVLTLFAIVLRVQAADADARLRAVLAEVQALNAAKKRLQIALDALNCRISGCGGNT
jgi:hypothetical protein